ncbi:MAG: hypothetical protein AAF984_05585 [Verrucomicrobiota bacterium]
MRKQQQEMDFNFITAGTRPRSLRKQNAFSSDKPKHKKAETVAKTVSFPSDAESNKETKYMPNNVIHTPIDGRKNIERQKREQRTVNQLLSGVSLIIIISVLMIGSLATAGGYVIYQTFQDQSVTIADLENNTKVRMAALEERLLAKDRELELAFANANRRITDLNTTFEEYRAAMVNDMKNLRNQNQSLERKLATYQQRLDEQNDLISQYQAANRDRRFFFFR